MGALLFLHRKNFPSNSNKKLRASTAEKLTSSKISLSKFDVCKTEELYDTTTLSTIYANKGRRELLFASNGVGDTRYSKSLVQMPRDLQISLERKGSQNPSDNKLAMTSKQYLDNEEKIEEDVEGED